MTGTNKKRLGFNPLAGKSGVNALFSESDENNVDVPQEHIESHKPIDEFSENEIVQKSPKKSPTKKTDTKKKFGSSMEVIEDKEGGRIAPNRELSPQLSNAETELEAGPDVYDVKYKTHSLILREDFIDKINAMAYWERKLVKAVVDEILGEYFQKNPVDPIPDNAVGLRKKRRTKKLS